MIFIFVFAFLVYVFFQFETYEFNGEEQRVIQIANDELKWILEVFLDFRGDFLIVDTWLFVALFFSMAISFSLFLRYIFSKTTS